MKPVHIFGGGTFSPVRNHLALGTTAFGETAIELDQMLSELGMKTHLHLTKMADPRYSTMVTNEDVAAKLEEILANPEPCVIIFNVALSDYNGQIGDVESGKYAERLKSRDGEVTMKLTPADKIIGRIRQQRKDIYLIGFKTTCGATEQEQYLEGLAQVKESSVNLVLANDSITRRNMVITPEEARYHVTTDREDALQGLAKMIYHRHNLTYTRSEVVEGDRIPWDSRDIPDNLRQVVNYCIDKGAYKPFQGKTVGHFAVDKGEGKILTSERKTNFNDLPQNGLIQIVTNGTNNVIAIGGKPSVGGQSQDKIFKEHGSKGLRCIAHFHSPLSDDSDINVVSQWQYECGSHECGQNASSGLREVEYGIWAVFMENHGPIILFREDVLAERVIAVIEKNFDLSQKIGGPVSLSQVG